MGIVGAFFLESNKGVVTGGGASLVVKSGVDVAISLVTVDGKQNREGSGFSSPQFLADEEGFTEGRGGSGNAVAFQVDVENGILGSSPCAGNSHTFGFGVDRLSAGKALDISGAIFFGISSGGGVAENGRVSRPNSNSGIDTLNPEIVGGGREKSYNVRVGGG